MDDGVGTTPPAAAIQRDIACAAPQGSHRREPGRTLHRASDDRDHAAGVFVRFGTGFRQDRRTRNDDPVGAGNVEVDDPDRAAGRRGGMQNMGRLECTERQRQGDGRIPRPIGGLGGVGMGAARQIDGDDDAGSMRQAGEVCVELGGQRPGEAGAEQAVDEDRRGRHLVKRHDVANPAAARAARRRGSGLATGRHSNAQTCRMQGGCGNIAVTTVIARPADDQNLGTGGKAAHRPGDPLPRPLHQPFDCRAPGNSGVFGSAHRCRGEDRLAGAGNHTPLLMVAGRR